MIIVLVALAGGLGAATRFVVDGAVRSRRPSTFPVATSVVNVSGSLLVGVVAGLLLYADLGATWALVLATGFCGGYTTFSTAMVETVRLLQAGEYRRAVIATLGTLVACVVAAAAGLGAVRVAMSLVGA